VRPPGRPASAKLPPDPAVDESRDPPPVAGLGPLIEEEADRVNSAAASHPGPRGGPAEGRGLPDDLPAELGGPDMRLDDQIRVIETLAPARRSRGLERLDPRRRRLPSPDGGPRDRPRAVSEPGSADGPTAFPPGRADAVGGDKSGERDWEFGSGDTQLRACGCSGFRRYDRARTPRATPCVGPGFRWRRSPCHRHLALDGPPRHGQRDLLGRAPVVPGRALHRRPAGRDTAAGSRHRTFLAAKGAGVPARIARRALDSSTPSPGDAGHRSTVRTEPEVAIAVGEAEHTSSARGLVLAPRRRLRHGVGGGSRRPSGGPDVGGHHGGGPLSRTAARSW